MAAMSIVLFECLNFQNCSYLIELYHGRNVPSFVFFSVTTEPFKAIMAGMYIGWSITKFQLFVSIGNQKWSSPLGNLTLDPIGKYLNIIVF